MEYERLKENLQILDAHNHGQGKVINLTGGQKTESILLHEVISDCREILNKIEQGKMIELPCKAGDTVWTINCWQGYGRKELGERHIVTRYELHENVCGRIEIHEENYWKGKVVVIPKEKYMGVTPWVFLTREEAEKRLKELQG